MNAIIHTILLSGPSDPTEAKTYASDTIRSKYGKDIVHNCIYISENITQAKQDANLLFPVSCKKKGKRMKEKTCMYVLVCVICCTDSMFM